MAEREFLGDFRRHPVTLEVKGLEPQGLYLGRGSGALEALVAWADGRPAGGLMHRAWKERLSGRAAPLLLVVLYDDLAAICGPSGEEPPVYHDIDCELAENICRAALREPSRHAAIRRLQAIQPYLDTELPAVRNEGFLTLHELKHRLPHQHEFAEATEKACPALDKRGREVLAELGFEIEQEDDRTFLLRVDRLPRAVAVLVFPDEVPDIASPALANRSPISYALSKAETLGVEYVLLLTDHSLRLHPVRDGVGVAQRGRADTFVEIDLDLLPPALAGYLWLLMSAEALRQGGTFEEILKNARDHAVGVGERLWERIYEKVIPKLAVALWNARGISKPTQEELAQTYEMALTLLFRLLFNRLRRGQGPAAVSHQ